MTLQHITFCRVSLFHYFPIVPRKYVPLLYHVIYIYISHLIATTCCFYKLHCRPSWECVFKIPVDIDISLYHGKSSINYSKIENLVVSTNLAINQLYIPWNHSCSWDLSPFPFGFLLVFPWFSHGIPRAAVKWGKPRRLLGGGQGDLAKDLDRGDDPFTDPCLVPSGKLT